ncbi:MAG TPA: hypothetical protein VJ325_05690 [Thiobacillus sp.]|nr:hypothetical protein [Thiobacillus sp.]
MDELTPRLLIRHDWRWLWAVTLLSTVALPIGFGIVACGSDQPPPAAGGSPETVMVYLAWLPHPETVTAYRIYYGPMLDNVTAIRDVTQTETVFDSISDLHAASGQLCFRLTAINADGESQMTDGVCVAVP